MSELYEENLREGYAFEAERRHQLMLPVMLADEGFGTPDLAQTQLNELLLQLAASEARPFRGIEWGKLYSPDGPAPTFTVLDVFDCPVYLLINSDFTVMQLQAPVLKGLEVSEEAAVLDYLATHVPDLSFEMAPGRTLGAGQQITAEAFFAEALTLLTGFCNRVREAASYVRDHRRRLQEHVPLELLA